YPVYVLFSVFSPSFFYLFLCNAPSTTEIYTLSLHDALPISKYVSSEFYLNQLDDNDASLPQFHDQTDQMEYLDNENQVQIQYLPDRKSTRLNSSHVSISYAVFCLKKKKNKKKTKYIQIIK